MDQFDIIHEQHKLQAERRADESRAELAARVAAEGRYISDNGKCLVCTGNLILLERQPHLVRDWAWCRWCGNSMPCVEGVLQ